MKSLETLRDGISRCDSSSALHEYYIERLEKCNRTEEANSQLARTASLLFPDQLIFPLREALLPARSLRLSSASRFGLPRSDSRRDFSVLIEEVRLDTSNDRQRALEAIGKM